MDTPLSDIEQTRLDELESAVTAELGSFVRVGSALAEIRDSRLYRQTHETFEAYCQDRWEMTRRRANQLVEAAGLAIQMGTMVPKTERAARELVGLEPAQAVEVLERLTKQPAKEVGGAAGFLAKARGLQQYRHGLLSRCVAEVAVGVYNKNLTTNKIPEWRV